jgi:hypothetical protein
LNGLADYRRLWDAQPGWLNTASYGLPPRPAWDALQEALTQWRHGSTSWEPWDASTGRARRAFARLVHGDPDAIAVGSTVSGMLSVVAAGLPTGSRVVVPEIEFTSNPLPWLVQADRGSRSRRPTLGRMSARHNTVPDAVHKPGPPVIRAGDTGSSRGGCDTMRAALPIAGDNDVLRDDSQGVLTRWRISATTIALPRSKWPWTRSSTPTASRRHKASRMARCSSMDRTLPALS